MAQSGFLILGRVVRPIGVLGEVNVAHFTDSWELFRGLARVWLVSPEGPGRCFEVERGRERHRVVRLKLAGVDTPEAAARLVGYEVAVPRGEAPALPEGVFYHYDILGLEVVEGDRSLGCVQEILETPAHDVYVIRGEAGEWMLPATRAHIQRIDLAAGKIEIVPGADLVSVTSGGDGRAEAI